MPTLLKQASHMPRLLRGRTCRSCGHSRQTVLTLTTLFDALAKHEDGHSSVFVIIHRCGLFQTNVLRHFFYCSSNKCFSSSNNKLLELKQT